MPPLPKHGSRKLFLLRAVAGCERLLRHRPSLAPNDLRSIRNFLLLQYDTPLGSAIHATPLYEAIKRRLPDATIFVAASPLAAGVLHRSPFVDRCVVTPDPWKDFRGALQSVRKILHDLPHGPVCIATTRGNQRSRAALLAMLAGNAVRTGFTLATPLYHLPLTIHTDRSQIDDNLDILRVLAHPAAASEISTPEPRIFFSRQDADVASHLLSDKIHSASRTRIAYATQNSGTQPNQWRAERFQHVIRTLSQTLHALPIFIGSAREASAIEALRLPLEDPGISLAGKTTIPQLAAVLAQCDAIVSLDTGSFHAARAVQLPGVVLAPAWQPAVEWLPIHHPRYRVLRGASIAAPPANPFIDEISAEQGIAAANDLLAHHPPSLDARQTRVRNALCDNEHTVRT
ncbi:MAG TPA: glycosyltransferase family 9 protein [Acidobacteriaceae bacterium]|jgi:ADP-heptose:LPS heptosyltransferase|nr:glycosyltransferase family 9 protein [Acidobacteriaceae bacterium]